MITAEINNLLPATKHPSYTSFSDGTTIKYYDPIEGTRDAVVVKPNKSITYLHFGCECYFDPVTMTSRHTPRQIQFSVTTDDGGIDWARILEIIDDLWMDPDMVMDDPITFKQIVLEAFEGLGQVTEY